MNLATLAHSLLTGQFRVDRAIVREQSQYLAKTSEWRAKLLAAGAHRDTMKLYAGAEPGISRPYPNQLSTPEDYKQAFERIVLIRGARQMEEDFPFFDGMLDDFETYVVGEQLEYVPNTGNPEADKKIREFIEWQADEVDYSRRLDLTKMMQVGIRSMKRDGECGFVPVDVGDSVKLRYYSGDCIGNPMIGANIGPKDYNGIVVDEASGAPVMFRMYKRVPKLNCYYFDRDIDANDFWHYYDPFRFQQYHGVTVAKNSLEHYFDIKQIVDFSKLNIKWRASQLPTVHTETGRPRGAGYGWFGYGNGGPGSPNPSGQAVNSAGVPQPMQIQVDGVTQNFLKLDEQIMEYPNDFPNQQLGVMLEELRRECAKGAKLPIEFVYRADNGGVVQRFWVNKAEQTFKKDKQLMRRIVLAKWKNRAIQKGIDTGMLDLDGFGTLNTDLCRFAGNWQMGREISVDYGKENDTDIALIEAGLMDPDDKITSSGGNPEHVRAKIKAHAMNVFKDAQDVATATNQDLALVLPFISKKFPNPGAGLQAAETTITPAAPAE